MIPVFEIQKPTLVETWRSLLKVAQPPSAGARIQARVYLNYESEPSATPPGLTQCTRA